MMFRTIYYWVAAVLLSAAACRADEELDAWKKSYPAKLDALKTVQEKAEFNMNMTMGGMKSRQTMELEFVYRRPDALLVKGPFMEIVCLGTNLTVFQSFQKTYTHQPLEGNLSDWIGDMQAQMLMLQTDKKVLLRTDEDGRAEAMDEYFKSEYARRLPDEELDGRLCEVFADEAEGMLQKKWAKIWIDAETGLLRRFESIPRPDWAPAEDEEESGEEANMVRDMTISYTVLEQRVNADLPDERFAFVPPEDAKEEPYDREADGMEREDQAIQKASGLSRFGLSGQPAPDFELPLLSGDTPFRMSEQKDKVVVIDFWATWCGPCVRALPEMAKLAEAYADNPRVVIVGFSTDDADNREEVEKLVKKNTLTYAVGIGPEDAKEAYKVSGIPCVVVIGTNGLVQGRRVGYSPSMEKDLKKAVDALLAGETLESAEPYTEEELKRIAEQEGKRRSKRSSGGSGKAKGWDTRLFAQRWKRDLPQKDRSGFSSRSRGVESMIAPSGILRLSDNRAEVLDVADGQTLHSVELPESMCLTNEMGQTASFVYLRKPDGGVVAGYQEFYRTKKSGSRTHYETTKVELFGMPLEGGEAWTHSLKNQSSLRSIAAIPVTADEDALVATSWNELFVYTAEGERVLTQPFSFETQAVFLRDPDGKLTVVVQNDAFVALYEVIWPPAALPDQTEDEPDETPDEGAEEE